MTKSPFGISHDERTLLFIDGANLFNNAIELSKASPTRFSVDYKALLEHFQENSMLIRAHYHNSIRASNYEDEEKENPLIPLMDFLQYNGFNTVRHYHYGSTPFNIHAAMIPAIFQAVMNHRKLDTIVLFSSNDFAETIEVIKQTGVKVIVVAPKAVADDETRRAADIFVDMADPDVLALMTRLAKQQTDNMPAFLANRAPNPHRVLEEGNVTQTRPDTRQPFYTND